MITRYDDNPFSGVMMPMMGIMMILVISLLSNLQPGEQMTGNIDPRSNVLASDSVQWLNILEKPGKVWKSFHMYNSGDEILYYSINAPGPYDTLGPNESISVDKVNVSSLFYHTDVGLETTFDVAGVY